MQFQLISRAEAMQIAADDDAENMPFLGINKRGQKQLTDALNKHLLKPHYALWPAWYTKAELAANEDANAAHVMVEIPASMSNTGNPVVICLDIDGFDWIVRV